MKRALKVFAGAALLLSSLAATAGELTSEVKDKVLADMTRLITTQAFAGGADFSKWDSLLAAEKSRIDAAKSDDEFADAVNTALRKFGYSHIVLFTPAATQARSERKMVGLGIRFEANDKGILITDVFPGSPANVAGLEPGDQVLEANGKKPAGPQDFAGGEGTVIKMKVQRGAALKQIDVKKKSFSTVIPESLSWPAPDVAVLKIPTFELTYDAKRVERLMAEVNAKAKLLVLDLRSNPGGAVLNLLHFAGLVMPKDAALGTFISRRTADRYERETGEKPTDLAKVAEFTRGKVRPLRKGIEPYSGKMATLINGGTGSAAEMMAAACREVLGGKLIGSKSVGAVLASLLVPLSGGYQLQYPITDYVTIKGVRLEGNGLKPDFEAAAPKPKQPDKAVQLAIDWFRGKD